ncbi:uncharacterized PE-PGRS family protein PE_PGRS54-like [Schistocerca cancellata]|uniref:uncharacterized PE-PGRS family protein PE_PGRS54-like n=1 Tax=Schistocerca cancellata TaxID=274614 RepID=UPI0021184EEB|nr:uncharacterized PE-PGRS family protein PE_PGRS54-like [Schistocerca cancellata]
MAADSGGILWGSERHWHLQEWWPVVASIGAAGDTGTTGDSSQWWCPGGRQVAGGTSTSRGGGQWWHRWGQWWRPRGCGAALAPPGGLGSGALQEGSGRNWHCWGQGAGGGRWQVGLASPGAAGSGGIQEEAVGTGTAGGSGGVKGGGEQHWHCQGH